VAIKERFGRVGRVLDHAIEKFVELLIEKYKGSHDRVLLYNPAGDDSAPCKNDRVLIITVDGTGNFVCAGVLNESQGAKPGEKIFYGRDADGKVVSTLKMLNDGSIKGEGKEITLDADTIALNGGGKQAARTDDEVEVTILAGSFIVSVTGQATGTPNPNPVTVKGKITAGSGSVEVGD
jgi:hypothetical protein